jgi:hypothetical protein
MEGTMIKKINIIYLLIILISFSTLKAGNYFDIYGALLVLMVWQMR